LDPACSRSPWPAVGTDVFLIEPWTVMRFASVAEAMAFAVFLAGWLVFCILAERVYRQSQRDHDVRTAAENSSSQANRLAQLTAALAQARTPRAAIEASLQEPLHALKADAGMLLLTSRDGQTAEIARAVAYPEGAHPEKISLAEPGPISDAVGRGAPIFLPSAVVVPLLIGSRVVAVVKLDFSARRELSTDDHEYVRAFATYAARALDRTWQLEFAERARSDAEHLRAPGPPGTGGTQNH
jgi:K+-sensing histidine kinase KdpD